MIVLLGNIRMWHVALLETRITALGFNHNVEKPVTLYTKQITMKRVPADSDRCCFIFTVCQTSEYFMHISLLLVQVTAGLVANMHHRTPSGQVSLLQGIYLHTSECTAHFCTDAV